MKFPFINYNNIFVRIMQYSLSGSAYATTPQLPPSPPQGQEQVVLPEADAHPLQRGPHLRQGEHQQGGSQGPHEEEEGQEHGAHPV